MNDRESQLWKRCILVLYIIKKLEFFTLFSREKEWNLKCFHLFREWKVKWECLEIEIENEKWNEKALKSRSRVKSEMKMPRDRDREVKFQNNSREFSRNETLAGYCCWFNHFKKDVLWDTLVMPCHRKINHCNNYYRPKANVKSYSIWSNYLGKAQHSMAMEQNLG